MQDEKYGMKEEEQVQGLHRLPLRVEASSHPMTFVMMTMWKDVVAPRSMPTKRASEWSDRMTWACRGNAAAWSRPVDVARLPRAWPAPGGRRGEQRASGGA